MTEPSREELKTKLHDRLRILGFSRLSKKERKTIIDNALKETIPNTKLS